MKDFILFIIFASVVYLFLLVLLTLKQTSSFDLAGGHCCKQEKNSVVRTFRMMAVNRIATITTWTDILWQVCCVAWLFDFSDEL